MRFFFDEAAITYPWILVPKQSATYGNFRNTIYLKRSKFPALLMLHGKEAKEFAEKGQICACKLRFAHLCFVPYM